ncbi:DUF4407 domain-containing protein [Nonomuraea sp. NPDC046570]|uniref:DUF4407 domain-containing protein n=1 Tax=Nonomuraea sp. NPDC046570 TaxID=3155255 RepID=UPI0033E6EDC4
MGGSTWGRWLRALAGANEDLLRWTPYERPRYTLLGAALLSAVAVSSGSTGVALGMMGVRPGFLVPLALVWGIMMLILDQWILLTTRGYGGWTRVRVMAPRLLLSFLIGLTVAEPLLMKVFEAEIGPPAGGGLLARTEAFQRLVDGSPSTQVAVWLVRLLFVLLGSLPLWLRLMFGTSEYDRLLDERRSIYQPGQRALERELQHDVVRHRAPGGPSDGSPPVRQVMRVLGLGDGSAS